MRFDVDTYREIADSLVRNKSRSLLTGFGVFWGIFMLLFLIGGGQGLRQLITSNFEGFATNTAVVVPMATTKAWKGMKDGRSWDMTYTDIERFRRMIPELETVTPLLSRWGQEAVNGSNTVEANVKGVYADYSKIEEPRMKYGRYINDSDVAQERKVCVIGKRIYTSLFPGGGDPCGSMIKVGPVYYQVVGVDFSAGNMNINGSADEAVVVPLPLVQKIYHFGNDIGLLCVTGKPGIKMSTLEDRMRQIMAREHNFDPSDKNAMLIINTEQMFAIVDNLFTGLNFLIWLVGDSVCRAAAEAAREDSQRPPGCRARGLPDRILDRNRGRGAAHAARRGGRPCPGLQGHGDQTRGRNERRIIKTQDNETYIQVHHLRTDWSALHRHFRVPVQELQAPAGTLHGA